MRSQAVPKHGVRSLGAHKTRCCSWFVGGFSIILIWGNLFFFRAWAPLCSRWRRRRWAPALRWGRQLELLRRLPGKGRRKRGLPGRGGRRRLRRLAQVAEAVVLLPDLTIAAAHGEKLQRAARGRAAAGSNHSSLVTMDYEAPRIKHGENHAMFSDKWRPRDLHDNSKHRSFAEAPRIIVAKTMPCLVKKCCFFTQHGMVFAVFADESEGELHCFRTTLRRQNTEFLVSA